MKVTEEGSFDAIKLFRNLEILSVNDPYGWYGSKKVLIKTPLIMPKLKHIKLHNVKIFCPAFVTMVEQMEFLEQIDLSDGGDISFDVEQCKSTWN